MDFGIIVDLETTGLNPLEDEIIEIGILEFSVNQSIKPTLARCYGALQQPSKPLTPIIQKITGLTDEALVNQKIDWPLVRQYLEQASIVIAHNAAFDRSFLERQPELSSLDLHWGCSQKHIDWHKHGFKSRALNYLACDHGFLNPFAHRAMFDCATTFRLITPYLGELINRSYEREFELLAHQAPFDKKDVLREQGYRWNQGSRVWGKKVFESQLPEERTFLKQQIYSDESMHSEMLC